MCGVELQASGGRRAGAFPPYSTHPTLSSRTRRPVLPASRAQHLTSRCRCVLCGSLPVANSAHNSQGTDWRDSEHYQQGCTECQLWRPHPRPENLYLYLHAWKYSAEGWAYQTDLPFWVSDNCRSKLQA